MAIVIYLIYFLAGWLISRKFNRATKALPEGHFNKLLLFSIVFSVPLFYLGVDWGRWLAIHFHLLLLILLSNASMNTTAGKEKPTTRHYLVCLLMMLPAAFKLSVMIPEWPLTLRYFLSDLL